MVKMMNEDAHDASLADACPTGLGTPRNDTVAEVNVSAEVYRLAIARLRMRGRENPQCWGSPHSMHPAGLPGRGGRVVSGP